MLDVIIAGAGPAGSVAATLLARAGARVLIVDRETFPRDKLCGDTLNPGVVKLLQSIDLWGGPLASAPLSSLNFETSFCKSNASPERSWQACADCWAPTADSLTRIAIWSMDLWISSVAVDCSVAAVAICVIISPTSSDI